MNGKREKSLGGESPGFCPQVMILTPYLGRNQGIVGYAFVYNNQAYEAPSSICVPWTNPAEQEPPS